MAVLSWIELAAVVVVVAVVVVLAVVVLCPVHYLHLPLRLGGANARLAEQVATSV